MNTSVRQWDCTTYGRFMQGTSRQFFWNGENMGLSHRGQGRPILFPDEILSSGSGDNLPKYLMVPVVDLDPMRPGEVRSALRQMRFNGLYQILGI